MLRKGNNYSYIVAMLQLLPTEIASSYKSYERFVEKSYPVVYPVIHDIIYFDNDSDIHKDIFFTNNRDYFMGAVFNSQLIIDEKQAEDVVGDLCIVLFEQDKFNRFRNHDHAKGFCASWCTYRLKEVSRIRRYETSFENLETDAPNEETVQQNSDLADLIKSHFHLLTSKQQKYMTMQFIDGYECREISEMLGVSVQTINETTKTAINRLRYSFNIEPLDSRKDKSKQVNQCTDSGEIIETFSSIKDASESTEVNVGSISNACNGHIDTAGGFLWEFAITENPSIN